MTKLEKTIWRFKDTCKDHSIDLTVYSREEIEQMAVRWDETGCDVWDVLEDVNQPVGDGVLFEGVS